MADKLPEDGAEAGQLVELLAADVERGEDLDVAPKLANRVHQPHEPLPLRHVLEIRDIHCFQLQVPSHSCFTSFLPVKLLIIQT